MDIPIYIEHEEVNLVLYVTEVDYYAGCPATPPSFSCGGEPPEPEEVEVLDGYVQLDETELEIDNTKLLDAIENKNKELFNELHNLYYDDIQSALFQYIREHERV